MMARPTNREAVRQALEDLGEATARQISIRIQHMSPASVGKHLHHIPEARAERRSGLGAIWTLEGGGA